MFNRLFVALLVTLAMSVSVFAQSDIVANHVTVNGSIILNTNGASALNARDADGDPQNIVNLDAWGTLTYGPGRSRKIRGLTYIPMGTEHRETLYHGWAGSLTPGFNITPIGGGIQPLVFTGAGGTEFLTKNTLGDGFRANFGVLEAFTDDRASLWGMFNTQRNDNIDIQFGYIGDVIPGGSSIPPQLRIRYSSGNPPYLPNWTAYSSDGYGNQSTTPFYGKDDATFRRQFSISWYGDDGNVYFNVADGNNEFEHEIVHSIANGSIPDDTVPLRPFLQFRINNNSPARLIVDHVWHWQER